MTSLDSLRDDALESLGANSETVSRANSTVPARPGLYAIHGDDDAWADLEIQRPDPSIPLYVGKAQKSLAARDVRVHFGVGPSQRSTTGQSTLRRSLAALIADRLDLTPVPRETAPPHRFALFALDERSDARLSEWMSVRLRLATWVMPPDSDVALTDVESAVINHWVPPLNLKGSPAPWRELSAARARMAGLVAESVAQGRMEER